MHKSWDVIRGQFVYAPGQWETTLHCNARLPILVAILKMIIFHSLYVWNNKPIVLIWNTFHQDNDSYHPVYVSNRWDTALQCNDFSHWLGPYTEWSLNMFDQNTETIFHKATNFGVWPDSSSNGMMPDGTKPTRTDISLLLLRSYGMWFHVNIND